MSEAASIDEILKALRRFKRADLEYRRAQQSLEQPRLNKAGTSYYIAKVKLFAAAGIA